MTKVARDEVLRIAYLSRIALKDDEIRRMAKELDEVVTYAHRVCDIAAEVTAKVHKNINVFREDMIISDDAEAIQAQAPESAEHFFVVPAVLETNE